MPSLAGEGTAREGAAMPHSAPGAASGACIRCSQEPRRLRCAFLMHIRAASSPADRFARPQFTIRARGPRPADPERVGRVPPSRGQPPALNSVPSDCTTPTSTRATHLASLNNLTTPLIRHDRLADARAVAAAHAFSGGPEVGPSQHLRALSREAQVDGRGGLGGCGGG